MTRLSTSLPGVTAIPSAVDGGTSFAVDGTYADEVVSVTLAEATTDGWAFTTANGEHTITDAPELSEPTHVRIPDFVDGLPVRHISLAMEEGEIFRKAGTIANITGVTSLTLTTVPTLAFHECTFLESVNLPSAIMLGDSSTFFNCNSLASVNLPALTTLAHSTFNGCASLESVNFPALTTVTGNGVFYNCSALKSANLPLLSTVAHSLFFGCASLESVNLSALTAVDGNTFFYNCTALKSVLLGEYFDPSTYNHFLTNTPADLVFYYKPGASFPGNFWPNTEATENSNEARLAVPDLKRWAGPLNDGEVAVRDGNTFVSGTPWA